MAVGIFGAMDGARVAGTTGDNVTGDEDIGDPLIGIEVGFLVETTGS